MDGGLNALPDKDMPENMREVLSAVWPSAYRLARRACGEIVLQGRFVWSGTAGDGFPCAGHEWRDLPTFDLSELPK